MLTDAHTTDERPARASEGRTPPPPPPAAGRARGALSRPSLSVRTRRFSRRRRLAPPVSVSARARRKAPRTSARARPVDDRETPLSTRSFRAQKGHSLSLSRGAPPSRRAEGGSARRRRAPRLQRRGLEPRASGLSGGAPIALSRARSSRVFSRRGANRLEANAPPRRAAAPETKRNASRGGDSVGLVEPRSLLAEAIPIVKREGACLTVTAAECHESARATREEARVVPRGERAATVGWVETRARARVSNALVLASFPTSGVGTRQNSKRFRLPRTEVHAVITSI